MRISSKGAHGSHCIHDWITHYGVECDGVSDPGAACIYPDQALVAFRNKPIVIINRNAVQSMEAFVEAFGELPEAAKELMIAKYAKFCERSGAPVFEVEDLADDACVGEIVRLCTNQEPSLDLISTFQVLEITQLESVAQRRLEQRVSESKGQSPLLTPYSDEKITGTVTPPDEKDTEPRTEG